MRLQTLKMSSTWLLIFALFCVSSVLSVKKLCDIDDNKCITEGAARTFVPFVSGMPGVESSDPLRLDFFEVNLPTLKGKVIGGTLSGMKNCRVELVQISTKNRKYIYHVGCPHLVFESKYEIKGKVGPESVDGNGTCKMEYYDYNFLFNGDYERRDNNKKNHIHLLNNNLELEAKGKVHYDLNNLYNGDKEKSDAALKFANENWQFVDKLIRQPAMEAFMNKYIDNVNAYLNKVPVEDLFYQEYTSA